MVTSLWEASVSAQTPKFIPITPLAGQRGSDKRQKIVCILPALPDISSSYCISKYLKVKKDKKVRWGKKKIRKKI